MQPQTRKVLTGVAALAAAGGITAGIAGAARSGKTQRSASFGHHGWFAGPRDEPELTGDAKTRAEAAALAAVPGGTVMRSSQEDPAEKTGAAYEVHVADADRRPVEVLLDKDYKVVAKRSMPMGAPGHPGMGGPPHGAPLTGDAADKVRAAVLAALPGAKIMGLFAEEHPGADGAKYEAHVVKADGTPAEVVLDAGFKVLQTRDHHRFGRHGRFMGPPAQLTGEPADKAKAAALDAVPGGTVRAAFKAPPRSGAAYAVLVTRASAAPVLVLLDADFKVVRKLTRPPGMRGHHGPPGMGGPPPGMVGPPPGDGDGPPGAGWSPAPGADSTAPAGDGTAPA